MRWSRKNSKSSTKHVYISCREGQTINCTGKWKQTLNPLPLVIGNTLHYPSYSVLKTCGRVSNLPHLLQHYTLRRATTDPKFLWVLILMKLHMDLHVQASSLILSFWQTRCIFIRNILILRFQTNANSDSPAGCAFAWGDMNGSIYKRKKYIGKGHLF